MRYLPIRRERSVRAIAERVYGDLTPEVRARAEAALLKENPQLKRVRDLPAGSVVRVPELDDVRATGKRSVNDPVGDLVDETVETLEAFEKDMAKRFARAERTLQEEAALLRQKGVTDAVRNDPEAAEVLAQLRKLQGQRAKELKSRAKQGQSAVTSLQASIQKLAADR